MNKKTDYLKEDYPRLYEACVEASKNVDKDNFILPDTSGNQYTGHYRTEEEIQKEFKYHQAKFIETLRTASKPLQDEFMELFHTQEECKKEKDYEKYKEIGSMMDTIYSSMVHIGRILSIIKTDEGYKTFNKYLYENCYEV